MIEIKAWKRSTEFLTQEFLIKYFELEELDEEDFYWMGNEIGGVFNFGDYYFNFSDALYCLENEVEIERLFAWYDYYLENPAESVNLKHFLMDAQSLKEREDAYIKDLEFRVELAREGLEEALKNYKKI